MSRVIHFEIQADNPERAASFYEAAFGWKINKWEGSEPYWLVTTGPKEEPGIDGAIMNRSSPGLSLVNIIDVASVDETTAKVLASGGTVQMDKTPVPGIGYAAYYKDTEGNLFGVMQADTSAA